MYAIIETGAKQYRVQEGTILSVELLPLEKGSSFEIDQVLLIKGEDDQIRVGTPIIAGAKVTGTIVEHYKGDKVVIFKQKRRKGYRLKKGHRQNYTKIKIESIAG